MIRSFTRMLPLVLVLGFSNAYSQTVITQWNFNSATPDGSNSTGSAAASSGAGAITVIGGVTQSFASGSAGNGSSDPAATDNTGFGLTGFPGQGASEKTAGVQFAVSTAGYSGIQVKFDLRHSNTGPRHFAVQYTEDITAGAPVWVDLTVTGRRSGAADKCDSAGNYKRNSYTLPGQKSFNHVVWWMATHYLTTVDYPDNTAGTVRRIMAEHNTTIAEQR